MARKSHRSTSMSKLKKQDDKVAGKKEVEQYFPTPKKTRKIEVTRATERSLKSGETRVSFYETYMHKGMKGQHPLK